MELLSGERDIKESLVRRREEHIIWDLVHSLRGETSKPDILRPSGKRHGRPPWK